MNDLYDDSCSVHRRFHSAFLTDKVTSTKDATLEVIRL
jgi:hypothetical protein